MLEQAHFHDAVALGDADQGREVAYALGGEAAATQARDGGHPWIVPTAHVPLFDKGQQNALRKDRICDVEPRKLDLPGA